MSEGDELNESEALVQLIPEIQRAARHIKLEWPDVVETDDMEQDISIRLLTDGFAVRALELELPQLRSFLFRVARQIASGEQVSYEYFTGNYRYSTREIRSYLDNGALVEVGVEDNGDGSESFVVEHVDIRHAFDALTADQRSTLLTRFCGDVILEDRKAVTRAVDALTRELNRGRRRAVVDHEGPGSRRAVSNSSAQETTHRQENRA